MYGLGSLWGVCAHTAGALFWDRTASPLWNGNVSIRGESKPVREPDPRTHCHLLFLYWHSYTCTQTTGQFIRVHFFTHFPTSSLVKTSSARVVLHRKLSDYTGVGARTPQSSSDQVHFPQSNEHRQSSPLFQNPKALSSETACCRFPQLNTPLWL